MSLLMSVLAAQWLVVPCAWWLAGGALQMSRRTAWHWFAFGACAFAATLLAAWPRPMPPWVAALANLMLVGAAVAVSRGLALFLERRPHDALHLGSLLATAAVSLYALMEPSPRLRGVVVCTAAATLLLAMAQQSWRPLRREFGLGLTLFATVPPLLAGATLAARAQWLALGQVPQAQTPLTAPSLLNLVTLAALGGLIWSFNLALAALVVLRMVRRLHDLSRLDALTRLPNRRELMRRAEALHRRLAQGGAAYGVLLADLDYFKRVNDGWGHAAGDALLHHAAQCMAQALGAEVGSPRPTSASAATPTFARLGGEEFCALLPHSNPGLAMVAAERLRQALQGSSLDWQGQPLQATVSVGVALARPDDPQFDRALQRADQALYLAKAAGRNKVMLDDAIAQGLSPLLRRTPAAERPPAPLVRAAERPPAAPVRAAEQATAQPMPAAERPPALPVWAAEPPPAIPVRAAERPPSPPVRSAAGLGLTPAAETLPH